MSALARGRIAGQEFVEECRRGGVTEINPSTLPPGQMWAIMDSHGVTDEHRERFMRGFWEAMTGREPSLAPAEGAA